MEKRYAIQRKDGKLYGWLDGIYLWRAKKKANEYIKTYPSISLKGAKVVKVELKVIA